MEREVSKPLESGIAFSALFVTFWQSNTITRLYHMKKSQPHDRVSSG